ECANNSIMAYQDVNYAGLRYDNTLKYSKSFKNIAVSAAYSFGEVSGSTTENSAKAISASYTNGPLYLGAVYQRTNSVSSNYFNAISLAQASTQNVWGIGGAYQFDTTKWYFGYTNNKLDTADYKNEVYYTSLNYRLTSSTSVLANVQYDRVKHMNTDG